VKVIVVGNAAIDTTFEVEAMPQPGESILASAVREDLGGKGLNQAIAAARSGANVSYHAPIGSDAGAASIEARLAAEGIGVEGLIRGAGTTDQTTVFVTPDGENAIVTSAVNAQSMTPAAAIEAVSAATAGTTVLLQGNLTHETTLACARAAGDRGATVVINPSPITFDYADLWPLVDVVVLNEAELAALGGSTDATEAAGRLREAGAGAVVVTRGARSVLLIDPSGASAINVPAVDAIDTTGAGDMFCGVFVGSLAAGSEPGAAAKRAVAAAAIAVTRPGAVASFPSVAEVMSA
jgi:ribokinase